MYLKENTTLDKEAKDRNQEEINHMLYLEHYTIRLTDRTSRKLQRKYLESFEMWWRRNKIKRSDTVTNEEVLERTGEKRTHLNSILRTKVIRLDKL